MTQPDGQKPQNDLANELRELGQQIEQLVRSSIDSDRAKEVQRDITNGMVEIGTQMQSALKAIADNPQVQQLAERGQQAIEQAQQNPAIKDFQEALARGISQLNDQLSAFVSRTTNPPPAGPSSQPINIETDSEPNTGPTTRLDDK
jgi:heparin binding hemagglutinin HbhA